MSYKDEKIIGYGAFVGLCRVQDLNDWGPSLSIRADGVYVNIPPPGLTPWEVEALAEHSTGNLSEPTLKFPCSLNEFQTFQEVHGVYGCLDAFDFLDWYLDAVAPSAFRTNAAASESEWPWGDHETELLRHLAAAAHNFWSTYDPMDKSTAPKSADVKEWLMNERGLSRNNAEAIARMLRPSDVPTGPRK